ncbi:hypothetical protein AB0F91_39625 [Amycolatopsis sp. NPDC023774]|uniref:ATP-dependent DNA ligase n=1 Tax=Amycolatopsis sp. NPDC023774 TaxID=3155015 RepID=UPI0033F6CED5
MTVPDLPLRLAVAEPAAVLPEAGHGYEPKLDGWRCLIHVPAGAVQSRTASDLTDRFPGIFESAAALGEVVLDGELVAYRPQGRLDFAALGYGPARRRTEGITVVFVAFDLLGARRRDLRPLPYASRRERLEAVIGAGTAGIQLMRSTLDVEQARGWISAEQAAVGVEGALAKPLGSRYPLRGGRAGWVKVRHVDDVDALVLGVTGSPTRPTALVLGQADRRGRVRAVGLSTTLSRPALASLAGRLRLAPGGPVRASGVVAGLPGNEDFTYWPVEPGVVVEARADSAYELGRYRHRLTVVRAKPFTTRS